MVSIYENDDGELCDFEPEVADSVEANIVFTGGILSTGAGVTGILTSGSRRPGP